jgi:hypothetical protein
MARCERHGLHARRLRKSTSFVEAAAISSLGQLPSSIKASLGEDYDYQLTSYCQGARYQFYGPVTR